MKQETMSGEIFDIVIGGDVCTVTCAGQIAGPRATELRQRVKPLLEKGRKVTLDLQGVTYMDSFGLGVVAALYVSARSAGCRLDVVNFSEPVRALLSVSRLMSLFEPAGQNNIRIP